MSLKAPFLRPTSLWSEQGFILFEVLVAMSLIVGSWTALLHIYQGLLLRQGQLQTQKIQTRKDADSYEVHESMRSHTDGVLKRESSRVLNRAHVVHDSHQPNVKNER